MYYAPEIFKAVGAGTEAAFQQTVIIGLINLLFTFVAIYWVDRLGRKTLLLIGGVGMAISLLMVGFSFYFGWTGYGLLLFILLYIGSFAASYGPVTWVIIS
jgi:MFS family permease